MGSLYWVQFPVPVFCSVPYRSHMPILILPDTDTAICYCLLLLLGATIARPYSYRCLCVPHGFAGEDSLAFGVGEMPG